jgi:hypothetical protein
VEEIAVVVHVGEVSGRGALEARLDAQVRVDSVRQHVRFTLVLMDEQVKEEREGGLVDGISRRSSARTYSGQTECDGKQTARQGDQTKRLERTHFDVYPIGSRSESNSRKVTEASES